MSTITYEDYAAMSEQDRMRHAVSIASAICAVQGYLTGHAADPLAEGGHEKPGARSARRPSASGSLVQGKARGVSKKGPETPESHKPASGLRA